jgi:putative transposase
MTFFLNMVYEWTDQPSPDSIERLLWFHAESPWMWCIKVYGKDSRPVRRTRAEIERALENGKAIVRTDPFGGLARPDADIKESHRKHRDQAWHLIAPLVESNDPRIFQFYVRHSPISERIKETGCTKSKMYRCVRRHFQKGQIKNAQLPSYDYCGWRDRFYDSDEKPPQKKLGRPSAVSAATGEPRGVNITKDILQAFRAGFKLFYLVRDKPPLRRAFQLTLERFFNCGYHRNRNGILVPTLPSTEELPTYRQFKYWFNKERNPKKTQIARDGESAHLLHGRAKLGDSTQMAYGPGSVFQVDATIGDAYLRSLLNRLRISGRPVIYFVIDLFSRLIVGLSISLEGPSWLGAMLALENAVTDKVAFCAEYGISIDYDDWPTHHLPEALMADRGEFEGYNADQLVNAFGIKLLNTSPYRADLKGVVEQHIDLSNEKTIHWVPGRVRKRLRGDRDYRLDATLTLKEFRKIMILSTLDHNLHQYLENYPLSRDMIADDVDPYPINLWKWGLKNRTGSLREKDIETVRLNLLPEAEATVTQQGILFGDLYYISELALQEQWFVRAGERGTWKIRVAHDPRTRARIYLRLDKGKKLEICYLADRDRTFEECDWYEIADEFALRKQKKELSLTSHHRARADLNASTREVIAAAKEQNANAGPLASRRSQLLGIRENRRRERDMERQTQAWELGPEKPTLPEPSGVSSSHYIPPPQPTDKLRKVRERIMQK